MFDEASMRKRMEQLLFALMDKQDVGKLIAEAVLAGFSVTFTSTDGRLYMVTVTLAHADEDMRQLIKFSQGIDVDLMIEGR